MKKCASCTKDLPDAALHCVFCGAKQPPAPAVQQSMAKTAFGYSGNEVDQLRQQNAARPAQPPAFAPAAAVSASAPTAYNLPAAPAMPPRAHPPSQPPAMALAPTYMQAAPGPAPYQPPQSYQPPSPAYQPAQQQPAGSFVPASAANAKTMFVPAAGGGPPPGPALSPAAEQATLVPGSAYAPRSHPASAPPPMGGSPMAAPPVAGMMQAVVPMQSANPLPIMAIPAAQPPPYYTSQTGLTRSGRPIDPWRDSLRLMMFLWGLGLIAVLAVPTAITPDLAFNWKLILDGAGTARLPPLMLGAVGVLSVIIAGIPMPTAARGAIAAILGLAGLVVPLALIGLPPWLTLVPLAGVLLLVPGLLVRSEYRDAILPRLLVTLGAVGILLPFLMPQNGAIPLVTTFKLLLEAPGEAKIIPILELVQITIVVMSLLAWLPAPITGGAMLWAWLLILWSLVLHVTDLVMRGGIPDAITGAPNATLVSWIAGSLSPEGVALGSAYLVLVGYGLAAMIGKQLE